MSGHEGQQGQAGGLPGPANQGGIGGAGGRGGEGSPGETGATGPRGESASRRSWIQNGALLLVVTVTVVSALLTGRNAQKVADLSECLQGNQAQFATAIKARSDAAGNIDDVTNLLDKSQFKYLNAVDDPKASPGKQARLFHAYLTALDDKIAAVQEQQTLRDTHPFPTPAEVHAC